MELARLHPECTVHHAGEFIRAQVGGSTLPEVHECYAAVASLALEHKFSRVLIVGVSGDAQAHLSARDVIVALAEIGVPAGFKIAFVPTNDPTRNGHRHAELEARNRGLRAGVFDSEDEAVAWLSAPDVH